MISLIVAEERLQVKPAFNVKRILVCAVGNAAVDLLALRLLKADARLQQRVCRVGTGFLQSVRQAKIALEEMPHPQDKRDRLAKCSVVFASLSGSGSAILKNNLFDLIIVDEAGQATEASTLIAMCHLPPNGRLVLVGGKSEVTG